MFDTLFSPLHLLRPWWLLGLIPLGILLLMLARRTRNGGEWKQVCDAQLLPHILIGTDQKHAAWPIAALAIGGILMVIALAGPTWERLPQPVFRDLSSLVIALDLSRSMDATDIKPSRLSRARFEITDILNLRKEGQTALLVYADQPYSVSPLTDDNKTIAAQLTAMSTAIMPSQGSRADRAVLHAAELLKQAGQTKGDILLVTDGLSAQENRLLAQQRTFPYRISILAIGTADGAPIANPNGNGFLKDAKGDIVVPQLDMASLCGLAERTHGLCLTPTADESDSKALLHFLDTMRQTNNIKNSDLNTDQWKETGPWLLLPLLPLAALAFRRGLLVLALALIIPWPQPVSADWQDHLPKSWDDLWLNQDQQASRQFQQGQNKAAADNFSDPRWRAASQYRNGDFVDAEASLNKLNSADDAYNRGNALTRQGKLEEAIAAYDEALKHQGDMEDARHNRDLVKKALEQQQQQPPQQDPQANEKGGENEGAKDSQGEQNQQGGKQDTENQAGKTGENDQSRSGEQGEQQADKPQQRDETDSIRKDREDAAINQNPSAKQADDSKAEADNETPSKGQLDQDPEQAQAQPEQPKSPQTEAQRQAADETRQATEQWLRRIPDDPGGLWQRKFLYQYRDAAGQQRRAPGASQPW